MFFFLQGLAPPWFGSPGPLNPRSSASWCFGPLVASWLLGFGGFWASWLRWLLSFSASVALGFLASWLLGFLASRLLGFGGSVASQDLNNFISRMAT